MRPLLMTKKKQKKGEKMQLLPVINTSQYRAIDRTFRAVFLMA